MEDRGSRAIRILCAGLSPDFLDKLAAGSIGKFEVVVSSARSVHSLQVQVEVHAPRVVMLPSNWLHDVGLRLLLELRDLGSDATIFVVVGDEPSAATIASGVPLGLAGRIDPRSSTADVIKALDLVCAGDVCLSRGQLVEAIQLSSRGLGQAAEESVWNNLPSLTEREQTILAKVMDGLSNQEIADTLGISSETVKVHLQHVYRKLGVHRRTDLLIHASTQPPKRL